MKKDYFYLKFIFFIRYFGDSMFYAFTTLFLASIGFKEGMIGTISSITTITAMIVNPIWSLIAKNNKRCKILLVILSIIEGTLIAIYGNLTALELIMVFTSLLAICAGPYYNILDSYAIKFCSNYNFEYSRLRIMGSIAYVIGVPLTGFLIPYIGYTNIFLISGSIFILNGLLSLGLKKEIGSTTEVKKERDFKAILKNKWFIFYLIAYIFTVILSNVGDSYISLYFTKIKGLTDTEYSYVYTAILIAEVITIFLLGKFGKNIKFLYLMIISGLCYFLKFFILSFTELPLFISIGISMLRGVSWGMVLFYHMKQLFKLVGEENVTSAAILFSVITNLFQFLINLGCGYFIENVGYKIAYLVLSILMIIGASLNVLVEIAHNKTKKIDIVTE